MSLNRPDSYLQPSLGKRRLGTGTITSWAHRLGAGATASSLLVEPHVVMVATKLLPTYLPAVSV